MPFKAIRDDGYNDADWTDQDDYIWRNRQKGDRSYACVLTRIEGRNSAFNSSFVYDNKAVSTITSTEAAKMTLFSSPRRMNTHEMLLAQSFPLDYNFLSKKNDDAKYVMGMSVPPLMTANIADRIYNQWRTLFN